MEQLLTDIKRLILPIIIVSIYWILMEYYFHTVCPFKALTGIDCPACGLTRASIELLKGNITGALEYNASVFLWWISIILFIIDRYIKKLKLNIFPLLFIITSFLTIIIYFIKII